MNYTEPVKIYCATKAAVAKSDFTGKICELACLVSLKNFFGYLYPSGELQKSKSSSIHMGLFIVFIAYIP